MVSVVIPVFNASNLIERAVLSALAQKEVKEVLLVEDGSLDDSLQKCKRLEQKYDRVFTFTHKENANKGAGESRNLGIEKSKCNHVAFLDADDFYLENRFVKTFQIFQDNPAVDGVYECVGAEFENESNKLLHQNRIKAAKNPEENGVKTMLRETNPSNVFNSLLLKSKGWIHLNGLTLKRNFIFKVGFFNGNLLVAQDTEFILRAAYFGELKNGELNHAVAIRYVHSNNRITKGDEQTLFDRKSQLAKEVFSFFKTRKLSARERLYIHMRYVESFNYYYKTNGILRKLIKLIILIFVYLDLIFQKR